MTTRYGKKNIDNDEMRPRIIKNAPAFFVGPRYGKRMAWSSEEEEHQTPEPCTSFQDLRCDYTGISNFYRCSSR
ncbi:hypothetical protein HHI36_000946 [Cryptolaemus montrouzieri]|uniref:Uncharacterized protein n=1 Tax=Cryptolaemus montrouzieri TaxID=559131 RepID=A0ABD2P610_9CUCU